MRTIEYFINNRRLNYVLLLFVLIAGINAYREIPKELFPDVTLDMIDVGGGYPGSSAKILDKMAVRDIEDAIEGIGGIETTETIIVPGRFDIILTLTDDADPIDVLSKVKDAIAANRQYLPADMVEPVATLLTRKRDLLSLSLSSRTLDRRQLIDVAKEIKSRIMHRKGIAEVKIYGDSDEEILVKIDADAVAAYGISQRSLLNAISNLSYIYPAGNIEEPGNYVFLSTVHGKKSEKAWEEALIRVDGKTIRLGDVARVKRQLSRTATLSSFDTLDNVTLRVYKASEGDAIALSKSLRQFVET
ncbi:efflux RND transporter permease subunit, partial [Hydrogenimonas sp.]